MVVFESEASSLLAGFGALFWTVVLVSLEPMCVLHLLLPRNFRRPVPKRFDNQWQGEGIAWWVPEKQVALS
eukprot:5774920-Amphidinium_carterae.1